MSESLDAVCNSAEPQAHFGPGRRDRAERDERAGQAIKGSDLVVTFDAGGRQQLAWQVEVESDGPI